MNDLELLKRVLAGCKLPRAMDCRAVIPYAVLSELDGLKRSTSVSAILSMVVLVVIVPWQCCRTAECHKIIFCPHFRIHWSSESVSSVLRRCGSMVLSVLRLPVNKMVVTGVQQPRILWIVTWNSVSSLHCWTTLVSSLMHLGDLAWSHLHVPSSLPIFEIFFFLGYHQGGSLRSTKKGLLFVFFIEFSLTVAVPCKILVYL